MRYLKRRKGFWQMCFRIRADESRYENLLKDLMKSFFRGHGEYSTFASDAYELLLRTSRQLGYRRSNRKYNGRFWGNRQSNNFILAQKKHQRKQHNNDNQNRVAGRNGVVHKEVTCYACRLVGHYAEQCFGVNGTIIFQTGIILTQKNGVIENSWIFLDTCSTHSVSNNKQLVEDKRQCQASKVLTI